MARGAPPGRQRVAGARCCCAGVEGAAFGGLLRLLAAGSLRSLEPPCLSSGLSYIIPLSIMSYNTQEHPIPYKPSFIANTFLARAYGEQVGDVDQLKIQKLVYFLHGWYLATQDESVINEKFEAWPYGPVLSSLYQDFKRWGRKPLEGYATDIDPKTGELKSFVVNQSDKKFYEVFDRVWKKYKPFSGLYLSSLTHAPNTPWSLARNRGNDYLNNDEIKEYFVRLAGA